MNSIKETRRKAKDSRSYERLMTKIQVHPDEQKIVLDDKILH